MKSYPELRLES